MPPILHGEDDIIFSLDECTSALDQAGFDPRDRDSLASAALSLRRLGNNSEFLAEILLAELKGKHTQSHDSAYGPQTLVLSDLRQGYFLRANIWPAEADSMFRASGAHSFSYGAPHDHNFDFLTLGYFGPGYASDYWEYDYERVAGITGETAGLTYSGREILEQGKIVHYRAHRDVHRQLPPAAMSVSLNIMAVNPAQGWHDQYAFDVENDRIVGVLNPTSTEVFLRMAIAIGGSENTDLAEHFGKAHPSDRIRLASYQARSLLLDDPAERDKLWAKAEMSGSRLVEAQARENRERIA
ncbi:hypothetical protein GCM10023115_22100 [Pontixanthobacter gangjinensis]|uniref:transposase n=1 Tax=Pontixanthobacter gangjinensis TaxID=1028742 RepID=UPI0019257A61|nr:transposase [Pontixanthobacter gangjinensis]